MSPTALVCIPSKIMVPGHVSPRPGYGSCPAGLLVPLYIHPMQVWFEPSSTPECSLNLGRLLTHHKSTAKQRAGIQWCISPCQALHGDFIGTLPLVLTRVVCRGTRRCLQTMTQEAFRSLYSTIRPMGEGSHALLARELQNTPFHVERFHVLTLTITQTLHVNCPLGVISGEP